MLSIVIVAQVDAAAEAQQGKALFQQGKVEEALPHFQRVVELREKDATAWYNLAYANRKAGHFAPAAEAYRRYTQLAPGDPDGYFGLAESLRQSGKGTEALAAYSAYVEKEKRPSEQKWVEVAKQHIAELTPAPAPAAAAAPPPATTPPPTTPPAAPPVVKPDPAMLIAKGDAAFAAKDFRTALFAYQDAILADPKNVPALLKAAQAYAKMGHDPEAIDQWNKVLSLDPRNAEARDSLAAARDRLALLRPAGAVPLTTPPPAAAPAPAAQPPLAPAPVDEAGALAHYKSGVELINQRKYAEAVAELDQSVALKPRFAVALVARGSANIGLGKYQEALADYSAARDADPLLASPLFGLAEAYRGLGQSQKAAELYRQFAGSSAPDAQQRLKDYALQNAQSLEKSAGDHK